VWRQPRLDRSVEAALASGPAAASMAVQWRRPHATRQSDRGRQERERARWRILFFGRLQTRGSKDTIASGGDVSVRMDVHMESLYKNSRAQ
jgi:hypothetical protein